MTAVATGYQFGGWAQQLMGRTSHRFLSSGTNRVRVK